MGAETIILSISELAKVLLTGYFSLAAMQNKTPEEVKAELAEEMKKFQAYDASKLPEV